MQLETHIGHPIRVNGDPRTPKLVEPAAAFTCVEKTICGLLYRSLSCG